MKKLQEIFISRFGTEYADAKANHSFFFSYEKEYGDESFNYLFSAEVYNSNDGTSTDFICYVERDEDNSGIGIAIYYKNDKTFWDFKKIEL